MRILVVEDEMDMNRLLVKTLKREGYSVDGCFDGEEAWLHLMGAEYDAVVLDVMMPKKDGYTLIQELRERHSCTVFNRKRQHCRSSERIGFRGR